MASLKGNSEGTRDRRSPTEPPRVNVISFLLLVACVGPAIGAAVAWNQPVAAVATRIRAVSSGRENIG